jgi:superfamily II DNA/RNA helicase
MNVAPHGGNLIMQFGKAVLDGHRAGLLISVRFAPTVAQSRCRGKGARPPAGIWPYTFAHRSGMGRGLRPYAPLPPTRADPKPMIISSLSKTLAARGYDTLTAVQEAVTDPGLATSDLLVSAQTGSGKTVGFGLAIAPTLLGESETLPRAAAPLALIVAPTRELAFQVMRELSWLYAEAGARVASCVGGMDMRDERRTLDRGAHIVVGTPGRLCDHIKRGSLDMTSLRAVVLDEADEMLDLGFREDLEFMLAAAPEDRRTMLFSATVPPMIA